MMSYKNIKIGLALLTIFSLTTVSCKDMLDDNAAAVVEISENYNNVYDADNAIWGLYSKVSDLAENVVVLNELRADLMDVTSNASNDQVALSNHTEDVSNKYCDPSSFYEVILNCNDILYNFNKMLADKKISTDDYAPRYADVMAIRC